MLSYFRNITTLISEEPQLQGSHHSISPVSKFTGFFYVRQVRLKLFQIRLVSIKDTGSKSSTQQPGGGETGIQGWRGEGGEGPGAGKSHQLIEGIIRRLLINLPLF